jgi:hypothetical protein
LTLRQVIAMLHAMSPADALDLIREDAGLGMVELSQHAAVRMAERNVYRADVVDALREASRCVASGADKWKVTGPDMDGDDLDVGVAIRQKLLVVTVY